MIDYFKVNIELDENELYNNARKGLNLITYFDDIEVKIPKILRNSRTEYQKTKTELRNLKLIPVAPPVGYSFHSFNGDIFYVYDINKTRKQTEEERIEENLILKKYREHLNVRKTCPICLKVQQSLSELSNRYLINSQKYLSCRKCYYIKNEELMQKTREIKHDFISYFTNKGLVLNNKINKSQIYEIVYLDFETTGLDPEYDEVLQIAIIDQDGTILFYKLFKPIDIKIWDDSMAIHNITPKDVENELPFEESVNDISEILLRTNKIICYNCSFEINFLDKYNVKYSSTSSREKFIDAMIIFSEIYGEWSEYFQSYKWQKLSTAAKFYNYDFEGHEHNSLADVFALKHIYENISRDNRGKS